MKKLSMFLSAVMCAAMLAVGANAANTTYTVAKGDCMWKIAVKYQVGTSEIIAANTQIKNPNLIYPGQVLTIPTISNTVTEYETEVLRLVNIERANNGLKPLTMNWELSRVARYKSQDMHDKGYFSHTSPTYGSPFDMMKQYGVSYRTAGENIAMGQTTPQQVMQGWMNSPGHRANILNSSFTQIGVGIAKNAQGRYIWTQQFIG